MVSDKIVGTTSHENTEEIIKEKSYRILACLCEIIIICCPFRLNYQVAQQQLCESLNRY